MSVNRPGDYRLQTHRFEPIDKQNDEEKEEGKKKKVSYQGRSWQEEDEELPVAPNTPALKPTGRSVYADQALLERAENLLKGFVTLEEKVAQICFISTEAFYDRDHQSYMEKLIQKFQIGGVLFTKGEFRRQSYLIERYQELAKRPLLIGNSFLHGLSFYFQGEIPFEKLATFDERKSSDLGKAVVFQNKKLGCQFQYECSCQEIGERQSRSFRNGIREARGIVAKCTSNRKLLNLEPPDPSKKNFFSSDNVQEAFGLRTINFLSVMAIDKLLDAFQNPYDAFLFNENIEDAIELLANYIRIGLLKEADLDKRVLKVLLLKMLHFQIQ